MLKFFLIITSILISLIFLFKSNLFADSSTLKSLPSVSIFRKSIWLILFNLQYLFKVIVGIIVFFEILHKKLLEDKAFSFAMSDDWEEINLS